MATRKSRNVQKMETLSEKEEISIKEIWDVLEFAKNSMSSYFPGVITPDLINAQMQIKNFNPSAATEDKITMALSDPKNHEKELREYMEYIELASSPFKRVLAYQASQLAWDYTYVPENAWEEKDFNSPAYKKDERIFCSFMDRFDYKYQFSNVVKQLLRNEVMAVCPRFDGEKIVLQELPLNYIKITGMYDYGYLISFRFDWFLIPGVDIRLYPKWFSEEFNKIYGAKGEYLAYDPTLPLSDRGDSRFAQWADVPPEFGFLFKFDSSLATQVPYYASLMPEFVNAPLIRSLQKSQYMASASRMILGGVPLIKDAKAKVSDSILISPDALGKFLALIKTALGEAIKVAAAPLENMTPISFPSDNSMYSSYLKNGVDSSGVNAPLIMSSTLKANAIESQLSFQSDSLMMEKLYPQFNNFINFFANKETSKYKFSCEFEGNSYYLDRQQRFDYVMSMADRGIVLPQKLAAARGIKPHNLIKMMKMSKSQGFIDMLTPIIMASQMPGELSSGAGRPQKKDGELSDNSQGSRDAGSNIEKGGSI